MRECCLYQVEPHAVSDNWSTMVTLHDLHLPAGFQVAYSPRLCYLGNSTLLIYRDRLDRDGGYGNVPDNTWTNPRACVYVRAHMVRAYLIMIFRRQFGSVFFGDNIIFHLSAA